MSLDLTKVLEGCEGITLYSTIYGEVVLTEVNDSSKYPIILKTKDLKNGNSVTGDGRFYSSFKDGECTLFPSKDQRDWSKFKKPIPVDAPVMASNDGKHWVLRFYAGDGLVFYGGLKSDSTQPAYGWRYIVNVSDFDFENPESNINKSI